MGLSIGHIVWYDERLWGDAATVGLWARRVSTALTTQARIEAPVNKRAVKTEGSPGDLKRSIRTRSQQRTGLRSREFTISMAPHGAYVLQGTTGPIRADSGRRLVLPAFGPVGGSVFRSTRYQTPIQFFESVSGQRSNDFLGRAWNTVAVQHPAIRGTLGYN